MKGILFKPDMIKAITEGRKIVTRRLIKEQTDDWRVAHPRYKVGEIVYVKEAWHFLNVPENRASPYDFGVEYIDGAISWWTDNSNEMNYPLDEKKRSPMFLPEKFARLFLKILSVRPERLQEIPSPDIHSEGLPDIANY